MKINQKGFSVIEALLILVIIGLIGFTGWYVFQSKNKTDNLYQSAQSNPSTGSKTSTPAPVVLNTPPASSYIGWSDKSVPNGLFSFKYKNGWTLGTGEGFTDGTAFVSPSGASPHDILIQESDAIRLFGLSSQSGNKTSKSDNYGAQGQNMGDQVNSTESVSLNGVVGKRYTLTATQQEIPPPVKGEKYTVYVFYTSGRTYTFYYTQEPGQSDLSNDFDLLVKSIKFSS